MISVDNLIFTIINYVSYGIVCYWAGKRFIIPYLVHEQAGERAEIIAWTKRRDTSVAASNSLSRRHIFFVTVFARFSDYSKNVSAFFKKNKHDKAEHDRHRRNFLQEQYRTIHQEHQRVCLYQQVMPDVIQDAQIQLHAYYRDPQHVAAYFDHLRARMSIKKG